MSQSTPIRIYRRYRCEGEAHRERLRALLLPRLHAGSVLPRSAVVGRYLGICPQEALRHMRRVMDEAGVVTETRRGGRTIRRIYVVSVPEEMEMAA